MDLETISDNMAQKPLFYVHFWRLFGQTLLGHNITMATPKIPGNQKLFEKVCYMSQSFSFLDLTVSELYSKNQLGGGANLPPAVQNRVNFSIRHYSSLKKPSINMSHVVFLNFAILSLQKTVSCHIWFFPSILPLYLSKKTLTCHI